MDMLTTHTPNARNVTWGKECSNCRWICSDFLIELREISGCLASRQIKVQVLLCIIIECDKQNQVDQFSLQGHLDNHDSLQIMRFSLCCIAAINNLKLTRSFS